MLTQELTDSPLGKTTSYSGHYNPGLLYPILRSVNRSRFLANSALPFVGNDVWNAYEISWLNPKGKPCVATGIFTIPCTSPYLVESKSFKLYLNSFSDTVFDSIATVQATIEKDLAQAADASLGVHLYPLQSSENPFYEIKPPKGVCLDALEVECHLYQPSASLLQTGTPIQTETLYSNLLKSNCPVTGQPDWATLFISYTGPRIDPGSLLQYIVSYREYTEFHEHCVEQIFMDITERCQPSYLLVEARYTRRGGLDINPYRSSEPVTLPNWRMIRQ